MAYAIVPGDWDGETYKCYQITWPDSEEYAALLYGQLSSPGEDNFWDIQSGDVSEATSGILTALSISSLPNQIFEECYPLPETPRPMFRAVLQSQQTISANQLTQVAFDSLSRNYNTPEFDVDYHYHQPYLAVNEGMWLYHTVIYSTTSESIVVHIQVNNTSRAKFQVNGYYGSVSLVWPVMQSDNVLVAVKNSTGFTIDNNPLETFFEGIWLGPLA